jgi:hypothetical protein
MKDVFCLASNDGDFPALAECNRRKDHDGHHCDTRNKLSWDANGKVECPSSHDHGRPPNRAARRGNVQHPSSARSRADYRPGFAR